MAKTELEARVTALETAVSCMFKVVIDTDRDFRRKFIDEMNRSAEASADIEEADDARAIADLLEDLKRF